MNFSNSTLVGVAQSCPPPETLGGTRNPLTQSKNDLTSRSERPLSLVKPAITPNLLSIDPYTRAQILEYLLLNRARIIKDGFHGLQKFGQADINEPVQHFQFGMQHLDFVKKPAKTCSPWPYKFRHTSDATLSEPDAKVLWQTDASAGIANVKVLRVCRQLYHEGVEILYGRNSFVTYYSHFSHVIIPRLLGRPNMARVRFLTYTELSEAQSF